MQNEYFEFTFSDKSRIDEKSFFLWFLPHLSRPEDKPKPGNPAKEGFTAAMMGDKSPPPQQEHYSPVPDIFYAASYNRSTGRLEINVLTEADEAPGALHIRSHEGDTITVLIGADGAMRHEPLEGDALEVFYRHATFDEILKSIDPDGGDSVLVKMHKFDSCTEKNEKVKLALQIIRDSPKLLLDEKIAVELIKTLEKARWGANKAESELALNLLKDHLMPMRPGEKSRYPRIYML